MKVGDAVKMRFSELDDTHDKNRNRVGIVVELHEWQTSSFDNKVSDDTLYFHNAWSQSLGKRIVVLWSDDMSLSSIPENALKVVS